MRTEEEMDEYDSDGAISGKSLTAIIVAAVLVVAVLAAVLYFSDSAGLFGDSDGVAKYSYAGYAESRYAPLEDHLAIVSMKGVQVIDPSGNASFYESCDMQYPAVHTAGAYGAAYDIGGMTVRVFDRNGIRYTENNGESVVSASVNGRGYLAVCSEREGYYGHVTVYNEKGDAKFEWFSGESRVLSAVLSPDSEMIAVLGVTEAGSRISFFSMDSEEEKGRYYFHGAVFFDLCFDNDREVTAVSSEKTVTLHTDGTEKSSFSFDGKALKCYRFGEDGTHVFALSDYQTGGECKLVTVKDGEGKTVAENIPETFRVAIRKNRIAVMTGSDVRVYTASGKEKAVYDSVSGASDIVFRADGAVIAAKTFSAEILK